MGRASDILQVIGADVGSYGFGADKELLFLGGTQDDGARADQAERRDGDIVANGTVDAEKTVVADLDRAGYHGMGGNKYVVAYFGVVADMVAGPQDAVVADFHVGLNDVVVEDHAV